MNDLTHQILNLNNLMTCRNWIATVNNPKCGTEEYLKDVFKFHKAVYVCG